MPLLLLLLLQLSEGLFIWRLKPAGGGGTDRNCTIRECAYTLSSRPSLLHVFFSTAQWGWALRICWTHTRKKKTHTLFKHNTFSQCCTFHTPTQNTFTPVMMTLWTCVCVCISGPMYCISYSISLCRIVCVPANIMNTRVKTFMDARNWIFAKIQWQSRKCVCV